MPRPGCGRLPRCHDRPSGRLWQLSAISLVRRGHLRHAAHRPAVMTHEREREMLVSLPRAIRELGRRPLTVAGMAPLALLASWRLTGAAAGLSASADVRLGRLPRRRRPAVIALGAALVGAGVLASAALYQRASRT